jgi:hypothetical protein
MATNIWFKRCKNSIYKDIFHSEFIVIYYKETDFPEGTFKPEDGWESLSEDDFLKECEKNPILHQQFVLEQTKFQQSLKKSAKAEVIKQYQNDKEMDAALKIEFEEFRKWKLSKKRSKE